MHTGVIADSSGVEVARWLFTDRRGGFSSAPYDSLNLAMHVGDAPIAVAANRAIVADALGLSADRIVYPGLIHSVAVGVVEEPVGLFPDVDVLLSAKRKIGLATLGADCVPMVLVDAQRRIALTAHVGWRGAADGIVEAIDAALAQAGGSLKAAHVLLGPAICGNCYRVSSERRAQVLSALPQAGDRSADGVDLRDGLAARFRALGSKVQLIGECTAESESLFSHRRDGVTGRQAAAVVLR